MAPRPRLPLARIAALVVAASAALFWGAPAAQPASLAASGEDAWVWRSMTLWADGCRARIRPRTDGRSDVLRLDFQTRGPIRGDGPFRIRSLSASLYAGLEDAQAEQGAIEHFDPWNRTERRARLMVVERGPARGLDLELDTRPELFVACQSEDPFASQAPGIAAMRWHGMTPTEPAQECEIRCLDPGALGD
ncbi:MAG: hypothetical protein H6744_02055 [Deltaproteobacteria bacterium]|nr:hypothetical protein [Deltaproteobacteria bacterium]